MKRPFSKLTIAAALCGLSGGVFALGFGRLNSVAVLGQTLNLSIPIRLDPGEELDPACVAADVYFGDTKQLPDMVRVQISGPPGLAAERTLRVLTAAPVSEPVVTIYVIAGCKSKVTRKFVAFADPPKISNLPVSPATLEGPFGARAEPSSDAVSGQPANSTYSSAVPPTESAAAHAVSRRHIASSRPKHARARPATAVVHRSAVALAGLDTRGTHLAKHRKVVQAAEAVEPARSSRLVLDPVDADVLVTPDLHMSTELSHVDDDAGPAGQAVRERRAAAAALWRALNATPEQLAHDRLRLQELEARLDKVRADNRVAQQQVLTLQTQVSQARAQRAAGPMVFGLAGLSVALAVALGWLLLRQRRAAQDEWWTPPADEADQPTPTEPARHTLVPTGTGLATQTVASASMLKTAADASSAALEPAATGPSATPPARPPTKPVLREVSVEELIDLEQQAEFFMVLGQDDAAIDLLKGHIENTEGTSPLPYLKLLEVYQRVGDREAYEHIRERFNAQFNAYAPAWDADLQQGHVLADYVGVIERLQALWDVPERAMEVLQASLLRRNPEADTFDLPAYRELLFLYSVARDLSERDARPSGAAPLTSAVDVLLPFVDEKTDEVEPLIATRPVKTPRSTHPAPLAVDVTLDELAQPQETQATAATSSYGPIDFEPANEARKG